MSFGKVHASFFDSSVNELDPIVRFVFVGMIVLSDRNGKLDVTRQALARKLNLSLPDVERAIEALQHSDPDSRSRDEDGRRIVALDPQRSWGWHIVNKGRYRNSDEATVREEARERKRKERLLKKGSPVPSPKEKKTDTDTDVTRSHKLSREKRDSLFEGIWALVPRKEEKPDARKWFLAHVDSLEDAEKIRAGVIGYVAKLKAEGTQKKFWKQGNTLLRHAEGFVGWTPPADLSPAASTGANWG